MIKINDANADFKSVEKNVYVSEINTTDDIHIENSYLFLSDITTLANIKAQYDLIVIGNVKAKKLIVNSALYCFGDIDADEIIVNGESFVSGNISAINIQFGDNSTVGEIYTKNLVSNANVLSYGNLDIDEKMKVIDAVIGLEGISSAGTIECKSLIAKEYLDCESTNIQRLVIVDEEIDKRNIQLVGKEDNSDSTDLNNLFKDFASLSDYDSQEYKSLEKFNELFRSKMDYLSSAESTDINELISVAANLGEHLEEYEHYYRILVKLKKTEKELKDNNYFFSITKLSELLNIPNTLPNWMAHTSCLKISIQNIATHYSDHYHEIDFNTSDMSEWAKNLNILTTHKELFNELIFSYLIDKILNTIGYKKKAVDKFFDL